MSAISCQRPPQVVLGSAWQTVPRSQELMLDSHVLPRYSQNSVEVPSRWMVGAYMGLQVSLMTAPSTSVYIRCSFTLETPGLRAHSNQAREMFGSGTLEIPSCTDGSTHFQQRGRSFRQEWVFCAALEIHPCLLLPSEEPSMSTHAKRLNRQHPMHSPCLRGAYGTLQHAFGTTTPHTDVYHR